MRYGLGIEVMADVPASARLGSKDSLGWPGFGTSDLLVDPKEEMVVVAFSQRFPSDMQRLYRAETLAYQTTPTEGLRSLLRAGVFGRRDVWRATCT